MNLLITNDDGISAQGIAVLARAAAPFGKVTVVAPARQCSAMSHRITLGRPLRLETVVPLVQSHRDALSFFNYIKPAGLTGPVQWLHREVHHG